MSFIVILIVGLVEAAIISFAVLKFGGSSEGAGGSLEEKAKEGIQLAEQIKTRVQTAVSELKPADELQKLIQATKAASDTLKADKGRVTITQAELETVETRLRELEEIERELEASGIETEEELKILNKKEQDLASKNAALKQKIQDSSNQIDLILKELQDNAIAQEQILNMKTQLIVSEQKAEEMVTQIELGNDQYFELKRRYDALDIEYAQLYEKFSEAEAILNKSKGG